MPDDAVAVFDIDSTIMNTTPRNRGILQASTRVFPSVEAVIATMTDIDLGWGVAATAAERAGLTRAEGERLHAFWAERFFSNQWLACDRPYPGARDFLHWLHDLGITLVYLTGRDEPNMRDGTLASFRTHGLPVDEHTRFVFKPDAADNDIAFKQDAVAEIGRRGTVVLAVDNEPGNANTFRSAFREAIVLLMDTITAPDPAPLADGIHVFRRYPRELPDPPEGFAT